MEKAGTLDGKVIVAIDIGTTSAKVLAIGAGRVGDGEASADGGIRARAEEGYPLLEPQPGRFEQDPERIAQAIERSVAGALSSAGIAPEDVGAVAFSSAMHSLIAVGERGEPLTPCMTWADLRAGAYARRLRDSGEAAGLAERTGVPVHAMTPLCKLIWLREQEPGLFAAARHFIGIKEYVLHRWFGGGYAMDESVAGGTGLYNLQRREWDERALELAGIAADRLPRLVPCEHVLTGMRPEAAGKLGLKADVPVIVGAADGVLANLGTGAVENGVAAVTVGTSGAVRVAMDAPAGDPDGRLFCYALADSLWISGGPVNSGGVVLRWVRDKLFPAEAEKTPAGEDAYDRLVALAMETPPGAEGLLCLPHLAGERAPHWDEDARGVYFGLSLRHDSRHMIRATLEGIVFGLRAVAESVAAKPAGSAALREIRVSGGFARSAGLRQLMADIFGCTVKLADTEDASALGAAMLARYALGDAASLRGQAAAVRIADRLEPNGQAAAVYDKLFPLFRSLYGKLAPAFAEIAAYQRGT